MIMYGSGMSESKPASSHRLPIVVAGARGQTQEPHVAWPRGRRSRILTYVLTRLAFRSKAIATARSFGTCRMSYVEEALNEMRSRDALLLCIDRSGRVVAASVCGAWVAAQTAAGLAIDADESAACDQRERPRGGVWVIAETTDLPTKVCAIVVPTIAADMSAEPPKANYRSGCAAMTGRLPAGHRRAGKRSASQPSPRPRRGPRAVQPSRSTQSACFLTRSESRSWRPCGKFVVRELQDDNQ